MPGRITMMTFAATEFRVNEIDISLYVSLSNELGIAATGYTKEHFKLQLLHPLNIKVEGKIFTQKAEIVAVNDLKMATMKWYAETIRAGLTTRSWE